VTHLRRKERQNMTRPRSPKRLFFFPEF
jgi:hypothetical protein